MKPRIWEHKNEATPAFSTLQLQSFSLNRLFFCVCQHYLEMVSFWRLTRWELRQEDRDRSPVCAWLLRARGSTATSSRPTTCRRLSGCLSRRHPCVRVDPMTEPTTLTCRLPLHWEQQSPINAQELKLFDETAKMQQIRTTTTTTTTKLFLVNRIIFFSMLYSLFKLCRQK